MALEHFRQVEASGQSIVVTDHRTPTIEDLTWVPIL
jgi:hypothetical protein